MGYGVAKDAVNDITSVVLDDLTVRKLEDKGGDRSYSVGNG